jgi:hypothetical protein
VFEVFSEDVPDPLWRGDLEQVINETRTNFDIAWRKASLPEIA